MSERCRYGTIGLPSCLAGTRGERWWCKACGDHALIRWLVETLHYPFDTGFDVPPPVDHRAVAAHWNAWDGWGLTPEEAYETVAEVAGLGSITRPRADAYLASVPLLSGPEAQA